MTGPAIRIERLAAGGDGVGRLPDGRVVFVPRTAPGDVVALASVDVRRRFARAAVGRVVEPSPDRVAPRCAHFDRDDCGGCALQHLAYDAQLRAKAAFVGDALRRIAKLDLADPEIVANPSPFGWRTRLALAVDRRRGTIGLRRAGRPDEVFDLVRCEIAAPRLRALWDELRTRRDALPEDAGRLTLREDREGGLHVVAHVVESAAAVWPAAEALAADLDRAGIGATLWVAADGVPPRAVAGPEPSHAATVFEQVDAAMGERVRAEAIAALGVLRGLHVWDLYAGVGETTTRLAAEGATVESVEADLHAVEEAARRGPSDGVLRHAARVEDVVPALRAPDLVVANPPRAGVDVRVLDEVLRRRPSRIAYVSCDPATLARDLARLAPGFEVASVRAFDAFPQTAHVESLVALRARS